MVAINVSLLAIVGAVIIVCLFSGILSIPVLGIAVLARSILSTMVAIAVSLLGVIVIAVITVLLSSIVSIPLLSDLHRLDMALCEFALLQ